jgi:Na+/proline symporter
MVNSVHPTLFYTVIGTYAALVTLIGALSYRKTSSEAGFLVARRSLGPILGGATLMANQVSAGTTIGIVGFHYFSGVSYAWTWPLVWFGWLVAAVFVAAKIRDLAGFTLPDYFAARFASSTARGLAAGLILLGYSGLLAAQYQAGGILFNLVAGIRYNQAVIVVAVITVVYTALGGMYSNAYVGMLKACLLIAAYATAVPFLLHYAGGLHSLGAALHSLDPRLTGFWFTPRQLLAIGLTLGLGLAAAPYEISAIYSLQNRRTARLAIGYSFVFQGLVAMGVLILGLEMRKLVPFLPNADLAAPVLGISVLPQWMGLLVLLAIVVTFTRTGGAILLTAASAMSHDLYVQFLRPAADEREKVMMGRLAVILFGAVPVVIALYRLNLVNFVVIFAGRLIACCFFAAVVIGLNWRRGTRLGAICSMLGGAAAFLIWSSRAHPYFWGLDPAESGLLTSTLLFIFVSLVTGPAPDENLRRFFPARGTRPAALQSRDGTVA